MRWGDRAPSFCKVCDKLWRRVWHVLNHCPLTSAQIWFPYPVRASAPLAVGEKGRWAEPHPWRTREMACWAPRALSWFHAKGSFCIGSSGSWTIQLKSRVIFPLLLFSFRYRVDFLILLLYPSSAPRYLSKDNPTSGFASCQGRSNPRCTVTYTEVRRLCDQYRSLLITVMLSD